MACVRTTEFVDVLVDLAQLDLVARRHANVEAGLGEPETIEGNAKSETVEQPGLWLCFSKLTMK